MSTKKQPLGVITVSFEANTFDAAVWINGEGGRDLTDGNYSERNLKRLLKDIEIWYHEIEIRANELVKAKAR